MATLAWMDEEWDHPDKANWYQMQIACEIRRVLSKNPNQHQAGDHRIKFVRDDPNSAKRSITPEDEMAISKSVWMGSVMGIKPKKERPKE